MKNALFFDDQRVFNRSGFVREYASRVIADPSIGIRPPPPRGFSQHWQMNRLYHLFYQTFSRNQDLCHGRHWL